MSSSFKRNYFQQEEPHLSNQFTDDITMISILKRYLPNDVFENVFDELTSMGERVSSSGDIIFHGRECEKNPPYLTQYNAYGRRIDVIKTSPSWDVLKDISAEEGLIAIGYERKYGEWSRLVQYVKMYLFSESSAVFTCPLAMTDGASRVLEVYMESAKSREQRDELKEVFDRFTSTDPKRFWTSGQWMTERTGGSDVGGSETVAVPNSDGYYRLHGYKFFTSATTSEGALTLAKIVPEGYTTVPPGSRNLSLFFVKMRKDDGQLNNIIVHRLKDKFGTKAVPTAELELIGSKAILIGEIGQGVKQISTMLNITRIYAGMGSVSAMRRSLALARDYAFRRTVFGKLLKDQPLHLATLAKMEIEYRACLTFFMDVTKLLGKVECGDSTESEAILLRFLCPLLKGYTAKTSTHNIIEAMECFGGMGYMEDSHIPVLLRDNLVNIIWEGTTNVLSLDVWRAISRENSLSYFTEEFSSRLVKISSQFSELVTKLTNGLADVNLFVLSVSSNRDILEGTARELLITLAKLYMGLLLVEHADHTKENADIITANRWCTSYAETTHFPSLNNKLDQDTLLALNRYEIKMRENTPKF